MPANKKPNVNYITVRRVCVCALCITITTNHMTFNFDDNFFVCLILTLNKIEINIKKKWFVRHPNVCARERDIELTVRVRIAAAEMN